MENAAPNIPPVLPAPIVVPPVIAVVRPVRRLTALQVVLVLLFATLPFVPSLMAASYDTSHDLAYRIGRGVGQCFCAYCTMMGIVAAVYFPTRRISVWPAVGTMGLLAFLFTAVFSLGVIVAKNRHDDKINDAALADITRNGLRRINQAEGDLELGLQPDSEDHIEGALSDLKSAESKVTGDAKVLLRVTTEFAAEWGEIAKQYQHQISLLSQAGGISPESLKSAEDVAERRRICRAARQGADRLAARLGTFEADCTQKLIAAGVSRSKSAAAVAGCAKGLQLPLLKEFWSVEQGVTGDFNDYLAVLETHWGHWHVTRDRVQFDDSVPAADVEKFTAASTSTLKLVERESELQKRLIDNARQNIKNLESKHGR